MTLETPFRNIIIHTKPYQGESLEVLIYNNKHTIKVKVIVTKGGFKIQYPIHHNSCKCPKLNVIQMKCCARNAFFTILHILLSLTFIYRI
jgi:hypothetical protein